MQTHELKTISPAFQAIISGEKSFEIRENDRNFQVGDVLLLIEVEPTPSGIHQVYTGKMKEVKITYITDFKLKDGYVALSIVHI